MSQQGFLAVIRRTKRMVQCTGPSRISDTRHNSLFVVPYVVHSSDRWTYQQEISPSAGGKALTVTSRVFRVSREAQIGPCDWVLEHK